jgi:hypothetical protein
MGQEPLVEEEKKGGQEVVTLLRDSGFDVTAAFWLKEDDDESSWFLSIASKNVETDGIHEAYRKVGDVMGQLPELSIDPFSVKLIPLSQPLAKAVLDLQAQRPRKSGLWLRAPRLGNIFASGAYIYPQPQPAAP